MRFRDLVRTSAEMASTRSRKRKVELLVALLETAGADEDAEDGEAGEAELAASYLAGVVPGGALGLGPSALRAVDGTPTLAEDEDHADALRLDEVQQALRAIAAESGSGSKARREAGLRALFARIDEDGGRFLRRLILGELRQGALEGVMVEALSQVVGVPRAVVNRAWMLLGSLGELARLACQGGEEALVPLRLEVFRALQPMLAHTAEDVASALAKLERCAFEPKLDGARVQVHRSGDEVRVFTRQRNEVTAAVPEVVEAVLALPARVVVLDGETLALDPDGAPLPFQETMRRFGRRKEVESARRERPLSVFFFDLLRLEDEDLWEAPYATRRERLEALVPNERRLAQLVTDEASEAHAFFERAVEDGHEGVMAKGLDDPYEAGTRGASWLKVKRVHTLDLVVIAVEPGSGRRAGTLSNLHLAARDEDGGFVMLGKTFKGLTDEMLAWQTRELTRLEERREEYVVHVRPELVVEVAFDELQESRHYPAGMALRFARVKAHRPDKSAQEADTLASVRKIFEQERARGAGRSRNSWL